MVQETRKGIPRHSEGPRGEILAISHNRWAAAQDENQGEDNRGNEWLHRMTEDVSLWFPKRDEGTPDVFPEEQRHRQKDRDDDEQPGDPGQD